jgi:hypothetical protein
VWRTAGLALALSAVPATSVTVTDHLTDIECQVATRDLARNTVIVAGDLAAKRVRRSETPRNPVPQRDVVGRTLASDLRKGDCAGVQSLRAPLLTFALPLAKASLLGTPKAGGAVDLLFAPSDPRDARDGASVDDLVVVSVDADGMVVAATREQQQTILKYLARSRLVVRAR